MFVLLATLHSLAADPPVAFEYDLTRKVVGTAGDYEGYSDQLTSHGRYEIDPNAEPDATVHATYTWHFAGSDGKTENGREDRRVTYRKVDRLYTGDATDLDEYDEKNPRALAVWFWIDPAATGAVRLLDKTYTLDSTDVVLRGVQATRWKAEGTGKRNDAYGSFTTTWTAIDLFDRASGYILESTYEEEDVATSGSDRFHLSERFVVTKASYALDLAAPAPPRDARSPRPSPPPAGQRFSDLLLGVSCLLCVALPTVAVLVWQFVARTRIRPLTDDPSTLSTMNATCSPALQPFFVDFAKKARALGDSVTLATGLGSSLRGMALANAESGIGTIFASRSSVAKQLAPHVGGDKCFSDFAFTGAVVAERFHVLTLNDIPDLSWDTAVVRRMTESDLDAVEALALLVYEIPCRKWLELHLSWPEEIAYVAVVEGVVVGFGFATQIGADGRTHMLTVHPDHRNEGIATELVRARLKALKDLGCERVVTEIAETNVGSLHINEKLGFVRKATMVALVLNASSEPSRWTRR
jgi:ribosomal protein S18 acetylase RimI-like enzyme